MKRIIIAICVFAIVFMTACEKHMFYYLESVDTGKLAVVDDSKVNNRGFDHLIIDGKKYGLLQKGNTVYHASDIATILSPFANFGDAEIYTLYEVKTALPFKMFADNRNKILFCEEENIQDAIEYYSDYDNYIYKMYFDNEKDFTLIDLDRNRINHIINHANASWNNDYIGETVETFSLKRIKLATLISISRDGLVEDYLMNFVITNGHLYYAIDFTISKVRCIKIDDAESRYLLEYFS